MPLVLPQEYRYRMEYGLLMGVWILLLASSDEIGKVMVFFSPNPLTLTQVTIASYGNYIILTGFYI